MPYKRYKRRRGRRRKRRKMSFTRKVKSVVKKEFKKRIEMKFVGEVTTLATMTATGTLTEIGAYANIPQGTAQGNRIADSINMHKWMCNLNIFGSTGSSSPKALEYRIIMLYARSTVLAADLPIVGAFYDVAEMQEKGIYIIRDFQGVLAPTEPMTDTVVAADTYTRVRWCGSHPTIRLRRFKIGLKGRTRDYDTAGGVIAKGRLYLYAVGVLEGAMACRYSFTSQLWFTD